MASIVIPVAVLFAFSLALGMAVGRPAVLFPVIVGVGFGALLAVGGTGDTDALFLIGWLLVSVAIGAWGALVGARVRAGRN
jgi:hypothetical protein